MNAHAREATPEQMVESHTENIKDWLTTMGGVLYPHVALAELVVRDTDPVRDAPITRTFAECLLAMHVEWERFAGAVENQMDGIEDKYPNGPYIHEMYEYFLVSLAPIALLATETLARIDTEQSAPMSLPHPDHLSMCEYTARGLSEVTVTLGRMVEDIRLFQEERNAALRVIERRSRVAALVEMPL